MTSLNQFIEGKLDSQIEACIGVMGEKAYKGSYAAPREAFRKILKEAYLKGIEDAEGCVPVEKEQLDKNDPDNYGACYAIAGFNDALFKTLSALSALKENIIPS